MSPNQGILNVKTIGADYSIDNRKMIEINNLTNTSVDEDFLKRVAKKVIIGENKQRDLSVVLVPAKEIRFLNKEYREIDKITDVLSFSGGASKKDFIASPGGKKRNRKEHGRNYHLPGPRQRKRQEFPFRFQNRTGAGFNSWNFAPFGR